MMLRLLSIAVIITMIIGCSVRYGPRIPGFQPGYEEERLGEDTYQVRIGEAWPKDWQDLEKFALSIERRRSRLLRDGSTLRFSVLRVTSIHMSSQRPQLPQQQALQPSVVAPSLEAP